jgi:hypothetical protein
MEERRVNYEYTPTIHAMAERGRVAGGVWTVET